jgi:hypothetical protein
MDDQTSVTAVEKTDSAAATQLLATLAEGKYDQIIVGLHNFNRRPANQFGLTAPVLYLMNALQSYQNITLVFGNPYALQYLQQPRNLVACYEDDNITQQAAADLLNGKIAATGELPVSVNDSFPAGTGISWHPYLPPAIPESVGMNGTVLKKIDTIVTNAISKGAFPGCVVLVAKNNAVVYHQAFGYTDLNRKEKMTADKVFDLASVTKTLSAVIFSCLFSYNSIHHETGGRRKNRPATNTGILSSLATRNRQSQLNCPPDFIARSRIGSLHHFLQRAGRFCNQTT